MTDARYAETPIPPRTLLGPGPSNIHPRVFQAMATPLLGYLDTRFIQVMDETASLLREVFLTANPLTLPLSGTGSVGMEAALANVLEPEDTLVVGVGGFFGDRICQVAKRYRARVVRVEADWGQPLDLEALRRALDTNGPVKALAVVHVETSTGVRQPLEEVARLARQAGALLIVDAVTSLGGMELCVDDWGIDVCFSCTQKCVGAPPGLAPFTMSPRAVEAVRRRRSPVANWYLDVTGLETYWLGDSRSYHHTAPGSMIYALHEALLLIREEGLEARLERHGRTATALRAGLEAMGLALFAAPGYRADALTAVRVPEGVDDTAVRRHLLEHHNLEIGGGLGPVRGQLWRIGLMGYAATEANVLLVLYALGDALHRQGHTVPTARAMEVAAASLTG